MTVVVVALLVLCQEAACGIGSFFSQGRSLALPDDAAASVVTDGSHLLFLADPLSSPNPYPSGA